MEHPSSEFWARIQKLCIFLLQPGERTERRIPCECSVWKLADASRREDKSVTNPGREDCFWEHDLNVLAFPCLFTFSIYLNAVSTTVWNVNAFISLFVLFFLIIFVCGCYNWTTRGMRWGYKKPFLLQFLDFWRILVTNRYGSTGLAGPQSRVGYE